MKNPLNVPHRRLTAALVGCALFAAAATACGSSGSSHTAASGSNGSSQPGGSGTSGPGYTATKLVVGITNALTGPGGSVCGPFTQGASAYFDQVNSHGGVLGRKIQYRVLDDAYEASRAVANMRTLLAMPVFAFVGGCGTVEGSALAPTLAADHIPYLFPYAGLSSLTTNPVTYLTLPLYEDQIKALIPYEFQQKGPGSVYIIANNWPGYNSSIANAKQSTTKGGGTFLGSSVTQLGTADYTPYVLKIKAMHPDYVVINTGGADATQIVNTMVAQDALPTKAIIGVSTLAGVPFDTAHNAAADSKLVIASPIQLPPPSNSACVGALDAAHITPEGFSLFGCSQAQAFVTALKMTGSLSRSALINTLNHMSSVSLSDLLPPVTFTSSNHMGINSVFIETMNTSGYKVVHTVKIPS